MRGGKSGHPFCPLPVLGHPFCPFRGHLFLCLCLLGSPVFVGSYFLGSPVFGVIAALGGLPYAPGGVYTLGAAILFNKGSPLNNIK